MKVSTNQQPYYCGIDLHARSLYVCILDQAGNTCVHKEISADPKKLYVLLELYPANIVVGVEYMRCWQGWWEFSVGLRVPQSHARHPRPVAAAHETGPPRCGLEGPRRQHHQLI